MNADQIYDNLSERAKRFVSREAIAEVLAAMQEFESAAQPDERTAWDGDSEESRAAFRAYDSVERARLRSKWQVWRDACAWQAARATAPQATVKDDERGRVRDAIADAIGGDAYECTRVWSAWVVGTMSENDFTPIVNDESRLYEIADAAIRAVAPQVGAPNDAAITACALMIKRICMTLPQDQWSRKIEERIRFMLAASWR